jgi:HAE1 family hydrophobic/amphiphilic exporter-1
VLIDLANQVEALMRAVPGTVDILNNDAARSPETRLVVNRDQARDLGLSPAQVATTLRTALSGSEAGAYKPTGETDIDITLRLDEAARSDLSQLLQVPLGYVDGQPVTLGQVATVERSQGPARITRTDRQRVLTVGTGILGRTAGEVTDDVEDRAN